MRPSDQFWIYFWTLFFSFVIGVILTINYCVSKSDVRETERMKACVSSGKSWEGRNLNSGADRDSDYGPIIRMECK